MTPVSACFYARLSWCIVKLLLRIRCPLDKLNDDDDDGLSASVANVRGGHDFTSFVIS